LLLRFWCRWLSIRLLESLCHILSIELWIDMLDELLQRCCLAAVVTIITISSLALNQVATRLELVLMRVTAVWAPKVVVILNLLE
jgi:hypothetical protein